MATTNPFLSIMLAIGYNIGLKGSLIFSELERRFFEATHKKSSDLEKIKFGWSRGATAPQGGTL